MLREVQQPVAIFIDEIDTVLSLPFSLDNFFTIIRNCYNQRADKPAFKRLTFCLLGVATPSDLIEDKQRTPFNVGHAIALRGFEAQETGPLVAGLWPFAAQPEAVLRAVLHWTNGQPFLTQKICGMVQGLPFIAAGDEAVMVENLVRERVIENWEAQDEPEHLRTIRDRLLDERVKATEGRRLGLYRQVLEGEEIEADASGQQMELRLAGVVVECGGLLCVHNPIYGSVFSAGWVAKALGDLRPYGEEIEAWLGTRSDGDLLQGAALGAALDWAESRSLSKQDYEYLVESQKLGLRRELEEKRAAVAAASQRLEARNLALEETNGQLAIARQKLEQVQKVSRRAAGAGVGLLGLLAIFSGWAINRADVASREASEQRILAEESKQESQQAEREKQNALQVSQQAEGDKSDALRELKGVQDEQSELQAKNQTLAGENSGLQNTNNALKRQNQQATQDAKQAQAEQASAQQQAEVARQNLSEARGDLTIAQTDREQALRDVEAAEEEADILQANIAEQERDLEDIFPITAAVSSFAQGNREEAIAQLNKILRENSDNLHALIAKGEFHTQMGDFDLALQSFDAVIDISSDNHIAHVGRGNAFLSSRRVLEAVKSYTRALEIEPNTVTAENLRNTLSTLTWNLFSGNSLTPIQLGNATTANAVEGSRQSLNVEPLPSAGLVLEREEAEIIAIASNTLLEIYPEDADAYHYIGISLLISENYPLALEQVNSAIALQPEYPEAYLTRGLIHERQGNEEKSLADFDYAISYYSRKLEKTSNREKRGELHKLRGVVYRNQGNLQAAIGDFDRAISYNPLDAITYYYRGRARRERNSIEQDDIVGATEDYTRTIELDPQFSDAYYWRASLYYGQDKLEQAIEDFTQAIEIQPPAPCVPCAYVGRGLVRKAQGDIVGAIEDYSRAVEVRPSLVNAYIHLGEAYEELERYEEAVKNFSQAIDLDPENAYGYYARGQIHFGEGNLEQAIEDLTQAIEIQPPASCVPCAYNSRGLAREAQGDGRGAIRDFTQAIELEPQKALFYKNRGNARRAQGDLDGAIADYTQAIDLDPQYAFAYNNRGNARSDQGDLDAAIADYTQAIDIDPQYAIAYNNRGNARSDQGDLDAAIADYTQAIDIDPQYAIAIGNRGDAYRKIERYEEALTDLNRAIELAPSDDWAIAKPWRNLPFDDAL